MGAIIPSKTVEYHEDGSYTERYDDYRETSVTKESDGTVREWSRNEHVFLHGDVRTTYNGNDERINMQDKK